MAVSRWSNLLAAALCLAYMSTGQRTLNLRLDIASLTTVTDRRLFSLASRNPNPTIIRQSHRHLLPIESDSA